MKQQPELRVEEMPAAVLVPYARNAKVHTNRQVEQIASSIEEFGFNDPVGVWDAPDGTIEIVEGHGRVLAAQKLGMQSVPVVRLDHMTDEQRRAYALVHNKLTLNTGWDFAALDAEMEELDFDFDGFGFESENISKAASAGASEIDLDDFSEDKFENECPRCGFRY
ncbi:ParB/Srx family N-terminal domain-containing protein [Gordonibacter pamelaeae]|uniref:ParB/Srx family N-terminal domain-containing protein n=1 Tax=Gordonibacter pamelaeae TaxID=471189 RepID=UPI003A8E7088